tara:strand:- start:998 stop:1240 length:243 start_codon:yes stop_codon:yes gene_type:complete
MNGEYYNMDVTPISHEITNLCLTPKQLADRWGITRVWLYTLKKKGQVPKYRTRGIGKKAHISFPLAEVEKFESEHFGLKG